MESYRVRLAEENLTFSAAHFITMEGGCESLHGHNYRVTAEIAGPLGESGYVVDFLAAGSVLRAILAELDHGVLLPTEHPGLKLSAGPEEVEVRWGQRRWVFPRSDCRLLPLANTTAELLAQYLGRRLLEALPSAGTRPQSLRIEVEESPGQGAIWELRGE
ncbi:MAG: 6-pyruvoyl trahydropterin synthase family protein [Thermoguttaceae bacterium]